MFRYRFCPHLRTDLSEAILKHFPETATPESDSNWGYHRAFEQVPGSIKVTVKEGSGNFTYTNEFWSDGVHPKGIKMLAELLSKVRHDLGSMPIAVDNLLK